MSQYQFTLPSHEVRCTCGNVKCCAYAWTHYSQGFYGTREEAKAKIRSMGGCDDCDPGGLRIYQGRLYMKHEFWCEACGERVLRADRDRH